MIRAGYNATGISSLGETFGWQGGVFTSGTARSTEHGEPDRHGDVHARRRDVAGLLDDPHRHHYQCRLLVNLQISNATLANGTTLNVTTNTSVSPTSNLFITGTVANGGTPRSTSMPSATERSR